MKNQKIIWALILVALSHSTVAQSADDIDNERRFKAIEKRLRIVEARIVALESEGGPSYPTPPSTPPPIPPSNPPSNPPPPPPPVPTMVRCDFNWTVYPTINNPNNQPWDASYTGYGTSITQAKAQIQPRCSSDARRMGWNEAVCWYGEAAYNCYNISSE